MSKMTKKTCLIIKNDGIGDLIYASGLIAELSTLFHGHVDLITCYQNQEIAENLYGIRQNLYISRDNLHFHPRLSHFGIFIPEAQEPQDRETLIYLRKQHYTCAISLRRFIRQSTLALMRAVRADFKYCAWQFPTNASHRMAKRCSKGWFHYSGPMNVLSELDYYTFFIRTALNRPLSPHPRLLCTDTARSSPEPMTLGICLSAVNSQWPVAYWIQLAQNFQQLGWKISLFGGSNMRDVGNAIEQQCGHCQNQIGKLTFVQTAHSLSQLSACICNDSGLGHFASLIVPCCLIILGGGTFGRFFPWPNTMNQYVIYHGLNCFDCDWKCLYEQKNCLISVRPEHVIAYFNDIMKDDTVEHQRNLNPQSSKYHLAWKHVKKPISQTITPTKTSP